MIVVGVDPAMRNVGLAKATLNIDTLAFEVTDLKLIETEKTKVKTIRVNSDDLVRARLLHDGLHAFMEGVDMVFTEMPIGSQSASGMKSYAMAIMMLASIQQPLIQVMPEEIKQIATGNKNATKSDMIEWAHGRYPAAPWLTSRNGSLIAKNEHLADAVGAINAGVQHADFQSAIAIMRYQQRAAS